jgi:hypothetical protein
MRHIFYFAFPFLIIAQSAFAELSYCDDLWFTRNLILNRAGECIITPQAEALFDNSDCLLTGAIMSISEAERVNAIMSLERANRCALNADRRQLDESVLIDMYQRLIDIPARSSDEGTCVGYYGATRSLRAGANQDSPVVGVLYQRQTVTFGHDPMGDWVFVTVRSSNIRQRLSSSGWLANPETLNCREETGWADPNGRRD